MVQPIKDAHAASENKAKVSFWPSAYQVIGCSGCLIGAVIGPAVMFLACWLLSWLIPKLGYGYIGLLLLLWISVPLGAAAGTAIGMAIAERMKR